MGWENLQSELSEIFEDCTPSFDAQVEAMCRYRREKWACIIEVRPCVICGEKFDVDITCPKKATCSKECRFHYKSALRSKTIVSLFGEAKPMTAWCREFGIQEGAVRKRLRMGWTVEGAIMTRTKPYKAMLTAFGQTKSLTEWCVERGLSKTTVAQRVARGWPAERALSKAPLPTGRNYRFVVEFRGEKRSVTPLAERLGISGDTAIKRLRNGWTVDAALTTSTGPRTLTANGKTQSLRAWSNETGIGVTTLWYRIRQGWEPERVVAAKAGRSHRKKTP